MNKIKLKCFWLNLFWVRNTNKMPGDVFYITFHFDCQKCNYSCNTKTKKTWDMMVRLHYKKCKATGRTLPTNVDAARKKTAKINSMGNSKTKKKFITETFDESYKCSSINNIGGRKLPNKK
jgi:hypothetical protein